MNIVIRNVCDFYEVTKKELTSNSRKEAILWARHTVSYQLRLRLRKRRARLKWIAKQVNVAYPSTVWHSLKVYSNRVETDIQFRADMSKLCEWIEQDIDKEYERRESLLTNS